MSANVKFLVEDIWAETVGGVEIGTAAARYVASGTLVRLKLKFRDNWDDYDSLGASIVEGAGTLTYQGVSGFTHTWHLTPTASTRVRFAVTKTQLEEPWDDPEREIRTLLVDPQFFEIRVQVGAPTIYRVPSEINSAGAGVDNANEYQPEYDVTDAMQAWLNSVPSGAILMGPEGVAAPRYRCDRLLEVTGKWDWEWAGNVTIFTKLNVSRTYEYLGTKIRQRFRHISIILGGHHMVTTGTGWRVEGCRTEDQGYSDAFNAQHGWDIVGVNGFKMIGVTGTVDTRGSGHAVKHVAGDFVYLGGANYKAGNELHVYLPANRVEIAYNNFERCDRMAHGITVANRVRIHHNSYDDIKRSGIDVEPSGTEEWTEDIKVTDNTWSRISNYWLNIAGNSRYNHIIEFDDNLGIDGEGLKLNVGGNIYRSHLRIRRNSAPGMVKSSSTCIESSGWFDQQILDNVGVVEARRNHPGVLIENPRDDNYIVSGNLIEGSRIELQVIEVHGHVRVKDPVTKGITSMCRVIEDGELVPFEFDTMIDGVRTTIRKESSAISCDYDPGYGGGDPGEEIPEEEEPSSFERRALLRAAAGGWASTGAILLATED